MRVATNSWVGYAPLFLARELGYFDAAQVRLLELASNSGSLVALASGEAEVAALTLDELLLAREGRIDLQVLMVFDESAGADVVMARPDIPSLKHLRGHRIGVEDTATGALMLSCTLGQAGLHPDDVTKVPLAGSMLVSGYEHNDVDAVVCFEPYATQLSKLGARRLIDSSQFPGVIVDVLASKQSALTGAPRSLEQLLAGYFQAFSVLQNSPTQAAELMAPALGIRAQEVTRALRGVRMKSLTDNRTLLVGPSPELVSMAQSVSALMLSSGLLKARANLDKLVDSRFLPTA
jgi:NitT/TauT family transport system substrate-binding protein